MNEVNEAESRSYRTEGRKENSMKNYTAAGRYRRIMQIMMFLGVLLFLGAAPARVEAASAYKELFPGMDQTKTVKSGQYYFKVVNYTQVYMAKGKNGTY